MSGIGFFIDVFFVVFAIIIVAVGAKRGFIKNAMKLIAFVLSVIIAVTFTPMFSGYIAENWIKDDVNEYVTEQVISLAQRGGEDTFDIASLFDNEQVDFMAMLDRFGVDSEALAESYRAITEGSEETVKELAEKIADTVVNALAAVLAFVIIHAAAYIVLSLISLLLGLVAKAPVIKQLNTALGFICGVITAVAFVYVFATISVYFFDKLHAIFPDVIPANIREESFVLTHFSGIDTLIEMISESID
ncbi:MAG: CvpA family protein [Clostridia bacterium]|nr:CvpA family protein [Clostridia bacterium]